MRLEGIYIRSDGKFEVWIKITDSVLECAGVAKSEIEAKDIWNECFWFKDKKQPHLYNDKDLEVISKLKKEEYSNIAAIIGIANDNEKYTLKQTLKKLVNQYGMQHILEALISNTNDYNIHNSLYLCRLSEGLQETLDVYIHRY